MICTPKSGHGKKTAVHFLFWCRIAKVSKGGYYKWLKHSTEPEKDYEDYLLIKKVFNKGKRRLGFIAIQMKLLEEQIFMNHKKIIRIMNKYHLICKIRRRNPYKNICVQESSFRIYQVAFLFVSTLKGADQYLGGFFDFVPHLS